MPKTNVRMTRLAISGILALSGLSCTHSSPARGSGSPPLPDLVVEDFETYGSNDEMARVWYRPPHGGAMQSGIASALHGRGRQALEVSYETGSEVERHYAAVCRVSKWDLSGADGVKFWLAPDGSGRKLTIELNIANAEGKNIHDLWSTVIPLTRGDVQPREVRVPFAQLKQNSKHADSPDLSPVFKPADVIEFAFYVGGREDTPGSGTFVIDDIVAFRDP